MIATWSERADADAQHADREDAERQEALDAAWDDAGTYRCVGGALVDVDDLPSREDVL